MKNAAVNTCTVQKKKDMVYELFLLAFRDIVLQFPSDLGNK